MIYEIWACLAGSNEITLRAEADDRDAAFDLWAIACRGVNHAAYSRVEMRVGKYHEYIVAVCCCVAFDTVSVADRCAAQKARMQELFEQDTGVITLIRTLRDAVPSVGLGDAYRQLQEWGFIGAAPLKEKTAK